MTNRRMQDSDYLNDSEDDLIGLTSAFPAVKGPQSVEYDKGDQAIGLTGAFAPISIEEDERAWDDSAKWKDFDWESYKSESDEEAAQPAEEEAGETEDSSDSAVESETSGTPMTGASAAPRSSSGRGRHAAPDAYESPRMQQSRKLRRTLAVVVVLLVIVIGVVVFFMFRTYNNSQEEAVHQAQEQLEAPGNDMGDELSDDAGNPQAKLADVPELASLLGMTSDEAVAKIGHGAMVTSNREVTESGSAIKTNLNVALTEEPVDSKTGSPTVYLGLDSDGKVIQVGYSASASALGFGTLSFVDAVNNEHVVEKTLAKIGVNVAEGSAALPADKQEYSTFADDGTTVTRERCSFEGDVDVNGTACTWSSVLSYDYTTQIVTGDLSDTVRIIYVYLTQK